MAYEEIPDSPRINEKSGTRMEPENYKIRLQRWRESAREEARRNFRDNIEATSVLQYIRTIQGAGVDPNWRPWRSRYYGNRIAKARVDHLAQMTDMRPIYEVATQVEAYKDIANAISQVIRYEWINRNMDLSLVTVADIAGVYGTGFWRIGAAKPGEMNVTPCGPDQVMPIQPGFGGDGLQDSTAVLHRTWKSIQWLKWKFPYTSDGLEREGVNAPFAGMSNQNETFNRPNTIDEITWSRLAPGMRRLLGTKTPVGGITDAFFNSTECEEFFVNDMSVNLSGEEVRMSTPWLPLDAQNWSYLVKPMQPLFPRKRHIVFAGTKVLSDGPSPYWHGEYPYATLQFNPIFWSFWGLSKYRDLVPIQNAMNQIVCGVLDMIKRAVNPTALSREGGIQPAVWNQYFPDMPGMKMRVGQNVQNINDAMKYMEPPNIPSWVLQLLTGWLAPEFDRIAGVLDANRLSGKKQMAGGDTLEQMRDSLQTSQRLEERQLEVFLRNTGKQGVSNVIQYYTAQKRMQYLGDAGLTKMDFMWDPGTLFPDRENEGPGFWNNFGFTIGNGSLHSGAKDRTKQVAIALAARHQFPIQELYKVLELPNGPAIFKQLLQEMQIMGQLGGQKGGGRQSSDKTSRGQRNGKPV